MARVAIVVWVVIALEASAQAIGLPRSLASLVQTLLGAVDWRQRDEAARLLGLSGDPRVLEALATAAANDTNPRVRRAASEAILRIRGSLPPGRPRPPGPFPRPPGFDPNVTLVQAWFERYLGRSADPGGLATNVDLLRRGVPRDEVLSRILGSDEFSNRHGGTTDAFLFGLYRSILGRDPSPMEKGRWAGQLARNLRDRSLTARQFLSEAQRELLDRSRPNPLDPW